jgi:hypothetical protein
VALAATLVTVARVDLAGTGSVMVSSRYAL